MNAPMQAVPAKLLRSLLDRGPTQVSPYTPQGAVVGLLGRLPRLGLSTFVAVVLVPLACVIIYFAFISADMYRASAQFSVRGVNSPPFAELAFLALPGATAQAGDSYIVADYITSEQIIHDLKSELDVDLRAYYSGEGVDVLYRVDPAIPAEEFQRRWRWFVDVAFNSTTGNTELDVYAFSAEGAKAIADAVLAMSERLVNRLSAHSQEQLINAAEAEVRRTQERLALVRGRLMEFRDREQAFDPNQLAQLEVGVVRDLRAQLSELNTRRRALSGTLHEASPTLRVLESEIAALEAQISEQLARIGSGRNNNAERDAARPLSQVLNDYLTLSLEEEFAAKAYTSALTALEQAGAEARKQQRYFAIYVSPREPEVPMYPRRVLFTLVIGFWLSCLWVTVYFVARSVREHAI